MILRTEDWNRRNSLCKQWGYRAAIVYAQPQSGYGYPPPACLQRLRVKEFLAQRLGPSQYLDYKQQWQNTDSAWCAYRSSDEEYTIALKNPRLRDWCLLL